MPLRVPVTPLAALPDLSSAGPILPPHRQERTVAVAIPAGPVVPYAELHCHSSFSFLDGASAPDQLVLEAIRLGLDSLAITDHDGFYGAPLFAETAQLHAGASLGQGGLRTAYGAE